MRCDYKKGGTTKKKDPRLARAGVSGYNKPKRTPNHPKKSHVVVAKEGDTISLTPAAGSTFVSIISFELVTATPRLNFCVISI